MKNTIALFAFLGFLCASAAVMTGCQADPHDTHTATGVLAPR